MNSGEESKALLRNALLEVARTEWEGSEVEPDPEELQTYLEGDLPEEKAERVRVWLMANEGASDRLLELSEFVEARPPAKAAPADLAAEASWQALRQRMESEKYAAEGSVPAADEGVKQSEPTETAEPASINRWWQALAALLAVTSSLLLLRVLQLESVRSPQNLRMYELVPAARSGAVERLPIEPGQPFILEIAPGPAPDGCASYRVDLLDLEENVLQSFDDLYIVDYVLRIVMSAQPGKRIVKIFACDSELDALRVDLVADSQ